MHLARRIAVAVCAVALGVAIAACEREERRFRETPPGTSPSNVRVSDIQPGPAIPTPPASGPYENNAYAIAEGKRLYAQLNCVGCHAHGGGGMGPPLMDDKWIYGYEAANIYQTIVEGRPNGMPAFRNRIADQQVWMLVAYVQSMSGNARYDALPSRSDHMRSSTPENARRAQTPKLTGPR
jgi:cytochrome c oxidase cbb3-type subunit 3